MVRCPHPTLPTSLHSPYLPPYIASTYLPTLTYSVTKAPCRLVSLNLHHPTRLTAEPSPEVRAAAVRLAVSTVLPILAILLLLLLLVAVWCCCRR